MWLSCSVLTQQATTRDQLRHLLLIVSLIVWLALVDIFLNKSPHLGQEANAFITFYENRNSYLLPDHHKLARYVDES